MANVSTEKFEKALKLLKEATQSSPANDLERDGVTQRFEYTFEMAWKTAKKVLFLSGIESLSPKSVIRDLAEQGWIEDADHWMSYIKARNYSSHTYNEKTALWVYEKAVEFVKDCEKLLTTLKNKIDD